MRTNYLPRNKSSNSKRSIAIIVGVLIVGSVVFSLTSRAIFSFMRPIWQGQNFVAEKIRVVTGYFTSKRTLLAENERLKEELILNEELVASARAFKEREQSLLTTLSGQASPDSISAGILVHPPQSPYDTLVVDAGESNGVKVGDRVFGGVGLSIGEVTDVSRNSSRVRLYSTSDLKTNAILERGNLPVILQGESGGNFKLNLPRDTAVEVGDRITSPSLNAELIAVVGSVTQNPTDSFKEVIARSPINIFAIRLVTIR